MYVSRTVYWDSHKEVCLSSTASEASSFATASPSFCVCARLQTRGKWPFHSSGFNRVLNVLPVKGRAACAPTSCDRVVFDLKRPPSATHVKHVNNNSNNTQQRGEKKKKKQLLTLLLASAAAAAVLPLLLRQTRRLPGPSFPAAVGAMVACSAGRSRRAGPS